MYARFKKNYPKGDSKAVYAVSMPDYTVNDPLSCQILVTVPVTFESILSEGAAWTRNIKYIVLDEVCEIGLILILERKTELLWKLWLRYGKFLFSPSTFLGFV